MTIMQTRRVYLTGIGAITPFACGWEDVYRTASTRQVSFAPWPADLEPPAENATLGLVKDYPKERYFTDRQMRMMDKAMSISSVATGLALADAGVGEEELSREGDEIGTIFASMRAEVPSIYRYCAPLVQSGGKSLPNPAHFPMIARNVACGQAALRFGLRGWSTMIASGELCGAHALSRAVSLIASGKAHMMVVATYETLAKISLHHAKMSWRQHGIYDQLFSTPGSNADALSEGACVFVVESEECAERRGATPYARMGATTQGVLHEETSESFRQIGERHLAKAEKEGIAFDFVVSGRQAGTMENERAIIATLSERTAPLAELCVRPVFGDGGSQTSMLQVACAAQMLKDGSGEAAAFLAPGSTAMPLAAPTGAVVSQVGCLNAYALTSVARV
jgi:3-oxoacyl-[acyl-carrier-protein] synthase II